MSLSRRQFLAASAALASGGVASAIEPVKRPSDKPDLKLALAAYSFRQFLDLKKPTMTLFEFIDYAAELPLDAVEQAYVRRVLEHTGGKRMAAAQLLGISYPTFLKRLRELQLDDAESGVHAAAAAPASSRARRAT